jgi:hypothetical protein
VPSAFIPRSGVTLWSHFSTLNNVIHVKSCHSCQIMSFMSNHVVSFMSNHVVSFMSSCHVSLGLSRTEFSKVGRKGGGGVKYVFLSLRR